MIRTSRLANKNPNSLNQSLNSNLPNLSPETQLHYGYLFQRKRNMSKMDYPFQEEQSSKAKSTTTYKDIEELKDEILQLKLQNKELTRINQQLNYQLKLDERENITREVASDSSDVQMFNQNKTKDKLRQARFIIQEKSLEIEKLKQCQKYAKMLEYEVCSYILQNEIKILNQKNQQLQTQLKEIVKEDSELNNMEKLSVKLIEQDEKIMYLNTIIGRLKKKVTLYRWDLQQMSQAKEKYHKQFKLKSEEFEKFKKQHEQETLNRQKQKDLIQSLSNQIEEKKNFIYDLQVENEKLREKINFQRQQMLDMEEQYQSKKTRTHNKKEANQESQHKLDQKVRTFRQESNDSPKISQFDESKGKDEYRMIKNITSGTVHEESQKNDIQSPSNIKEFTPRHKPSITRSEIATQKVKLPKVQLQDVQEIGKKLRYKFMAQNISQEQIDELFDYEELYSIDDLVEKLRQPPFDLDDDQEALILSRYLIEDNSEHQVIFDSSLQNETAIIKSVLKTVIGINMYYKGRYHIYSEEESEELQQSLNQQIFKFKTSLIEQLKSMTLKRKNQDLCDMEDLKQALQFCNINLDSRQKEYLNFTLFKKYGPYPIFDYRQYLDCFTN